MSKDTTTQENSKLAKQLTTLISTAMGTDYVRNNSQLHAEFATLGGQLYENKDPLKIADAIKTLIVNDLRAHNLRMAPELKALYTFTHDALASYNGVTSAAIQSHNWGIF